MKEKDLGASSQQLYAQFLFRCNQIAIEYGFREHTVATFSIHTFMCSGSYKPFRTWWYNRYEYKSGLIFNASHFADVSDRWGVAFTVWNSPGITASYKTLPMSVMDVENFQPIIVSTKQVYNSDDREASRWVRETVKGLKGVDAPQMSSGLKVKEGTQCRGLNSPQALLYVTSGGNNVSKSDDSVFCTSSCSSMANGFSVLPSNLFRSVALFSARLLTEDTRWDCYQDEYLVPDTTTPGYDQWIGDCHIYALCYPRRNNCTSMRDVLYKGNKWSIKNHWFWMTRQDALKALDTVETPTLYKDAKAELVRLQSPYTTGKNEEIHEGDPYLGVRLWDGELPLSPDAQHVLDLLRALWVKSLSVREAYAAGKPELHLMAWDAGVYQLKHLWRDLFPTEWVELKEAHKRLAGRLTDGVYKFGFLKR
jgi:hypothetical protein